LFIRSSDNGNLRPIKASPFASDPRSQIVKLFCATVLCADDIALIPADAIYDIKSQLVQIKIFIPKLGLELEEGQN
jgi:hypothetical protein